MAEDRIRPLVGEGTLEYALMTWTWLTGQVVSPNGGVVIQ
jgi:hypothetical protein